MKASCNYQKQVNREAIIPACCPKNIIHLFQSFCQFQTAMSSSHTAQFLKKWSQVVTGMTFESNAEDKKKTFAYVDRSKCKCSTRKTSEIQSFLMQNVIRNLTEENLRLNLSREDLLSGK